jgi:DNA polymerase (family 10)
MAMTGLLHQRREADRHATARLADGLGVRFFCVPHATFTWALWLHTGSPEHIAAVGARAQQMGFELTPDGMKRGGSIVELADENALYSLLDLQYVEPELREAPFAERGGSARKKIAGVITLAAERRIPRLIEYGDLRGTFHCHTTFSDGKATIEEMGQAAIERGWSYLGIADHSQNASYAGGLTPADVLRQQREIDAWNAQHGDTMWMLKGVEADILADGRLDYSADEGVLESFDYVVGSVHSNFRMSPSEMTNRILRALDDPRLTMLGHMTGRLLLSRDAYGVDVAKVIARAAERGVIIEINADPARLDLDWRWWPLAQESGVMCSINPDAHSVRSLDNVRWGIDMARKGGLAAEDVLNTRDTNALKKYLAERHG